MAASKSQTIPTVDLTKCSDDNKNCDWEFLQDFYQQRHRDVSEIQTLRGHISQLSNAVRCAGTMSQKDRLALNSAHRHYGELELVLHQSEKTRIDLHNELQSTQREHQKCQDIIAQERSRHRETERTLEAVWAAHARLGEILSAEGTRGYPGKAYRFAELALEVESKSKHIQELNAKLEQTRRLFDIRLTRFQESTHKHFGRLDGLFQDVNQSDEDEHEDLGAEQSGTDRQRTLLPAIEEEELRSPTIKDEEL
ncbi:hypothetical protein ACLMJK_004871 [Lecanora helva]